MKKERTSAQVVVEDVMKIKKNLYLAVKELREVCINQKKVF